MVDLLLLLTLDNLREIASGLCTSFNLNGEGGEIVDLGRSIKSVVGIHLGNGSTYNVIVFYDKTSLKNGTFAFKGSGIESTTVLYIAIFE